jgi:hypothetical protein
MRNYDDARNATPNTDANGSLTPVVNSRVTTMMAEMRLHIRNPQPRRFFVRPTGCADVFIEVCRCERTLSTYRCSHLIAAWHIACWPWKSRNTRNIWNTQASPHPRSPLHGHTSFSIEHPNIEGSELLSYRQ